MTEPVPNASEVHASIAVQPPKANPDISPTQDGAQPSTSECLPTTAVRDTFTGFEDVCWNAGTAFTDWCRTSAVRLLGHGAEHKILQIDEQTLGTAEDWFFLGDIHGDFYAFYNAVEYVKKTHPDFRLVFLGDLIDRGPHPVQCLWYLLKLATEYPNRVLWLAGNHDAGIANAGDGRTFTSSVSPSEFIDVLNARDGWSPFRQVLGSEFMKLVAGLPRAALFPDGLLATHGGFPHTDLLGDLAGCSSLEEQLAWLNGRACLQDFTWTRISRYPRKIPNRTTAGCSYGFQDFQAFCTAVESFFPVSRLVTGHDHPEGGYAEHRTWTNAPALTLTGLAFGDNYEEPGAYCEDYRSYLVIGRYRRNDVPEVIRIPVDRSDLLRFFNSAVKAYVPWSDHT